MDNDSQSMKSGATSPTNQGGNELNTCYELFGVECGPGWKSLYEPLIELCKAEGVAILQIKEKYGTLRFYVGAAPDHVFDAIDEAEARSAVTCERCGAPGQTRGGSWIRTLCDDCNG